MSLLCGTVEIFEKCLFQKITFYILIPMENKKAEKSEHQNSLSVSYVTDEVLGQFVNSTIA